MTINNLRSRLAKLEKRRVTVDAGATAVANFHRLLFSFCEGAVPAAEAAHWQAVAWARGMRPEDYRLL